MVETNIKGLTVALDGNKKLEYSSENECDSDFHRGVAIGVKMGIDEMRSVLRVLKDFERLGLLK
jgi:hypothetical protein